MATLCGCCQRTSASLRLVSTGGAHRWTAALCPRCVRWLHGVIEDARRDMPGLVGMPTANGRDLLFDDQCRLCRRIPEEPPTRIACETAAGVPAPFPALSLCTPCDTWLAEIARDGRSAQRRSTRAIDGPYGLWLHPNLRALRVAVDVADTAARETVLAACAEMGVDAGDWREVPDPSVLFLEVPGRSFRATERGLLDARRVLLAPLTARRDLLASLGPSVADWLTVPLTPQQVTAALARSRSVGARPRAWDVRLGLPVIAPTGDLPPALLVEPLGAADPFELAWLLKRFARGYDDVGSLGGAIVLLPRLPRAALDDVARRIARVLGARASVRAFVPDERTPRLHVAG